MKWAKWVASGTLWPAGLHVALGAELVVTNDLRIGAADLQFEGNSRLDD